MSCTSCLLCSSAAILVHSVIGLCHTTCFMISLDIQHNVEQQCSQVKLLPGKTTTQDESCPCDQTTRAISFPGELICSEPSYLCEINRCVRIVIWNLLTSVWIRGLLSMDTWSFNYSVIWKIWNLQDWCEFVLQNKTKWIWKITWFNCAMW